MRIWRRVLLFLLVLGAVLLGLSGRTLAAGAVDMERETVLTLRFSPAGIPAEGVTFTLRMAAELSSAGALAPRAGYPALPEEDTGEAWRLFAAELAQWTEEKSLPADVTLRTDGSGEAQITGLSPGLYLVMGEPYYRGEERIVPAAFLVALPRVDTSGNWLYETAVTVKYETEPGGERLPQTGLSRRPAAVLLGSGMIFLAAGLFLSRYRTRE